MGGDCCGDFAGPRVVRQCRVTDAGGLELRNSSHVERINVCCNFLDTFPRLASPARLADAIAVASWGQAWRSRRFRFRWEVGEMGFLLFLAVAALGAIAWLLFRIDTKLQAIGDMIHDASRPEEQRRLTD